MWMEGIVLVGGWFVGYTMLHWGPSQQESFIIVLLSPVILILLSIHTVILFYCLYIYLCPRTEIFVLRMGEKMGMSFQSLGSHFNHFISNRTVFDSFSMSSSSSSPSTSSSSSASLSENESKINLLCTSSSELVLQPQSEDFTKDLSCTLCLEWFKDPVILPCGHNYCKSCIEGIWVKMVVCSCPECQAEFPNKQYIANSVLGKVVERIQAFHMERFQQKCREHSEPITLFWKMDGKLACFLCRDSQKPEDQSSQFLLLSDAVQLYVVRFTGKQDWNCYFLTFSRERLSCYRNFAKCDTYTVANSHNFSEIISIFGGILKAPVPGILWLHEKLKVSFRSKNQLLALIVTKQHKYILLVSKPEGEENELCVYYFKTFSWFFTNCSHNYEGLRHDFWLILLVKQYW